MSSTNREAEQLLAAARSSSAEQVAAAEAERGRAKAALAEAQRVARQQAMAADEERKRAAELELKLRDIELKFSSEPEPEPEPEPETKTKTETETEKEASKAASCPVFRACEAFVASFNLTEGTFDSSKNICYCSQHCARRHPDQRARGTRPYGFPKGWCGFGLQIDAAEYKRRKIFDDWHVAFHGTKKDTAVELLRSDWQLLMPGEVTPSGYKLPVRDGHIKKAFRRQNRFTKMEEEFDPVQIFTSPSIHYCDYSTVYCDETFFQGRKYRVAFQLRQQPGSYEIGQETVRATTEGKQIDPLFSNDELEYYTKRKGVHKLYRLLVRRVPTEAERTTKAAEDRAAEKVKLERSKVRAWCKKAAVAKHDGKLGEVLDAPDADFEVILRWADGTSSGHIDAMALDEASDAESSEFKEAKAKAADRAAAVASALRAGAAQFAHSALVIKGHPLSSFNGEYRVTSEHKGMPVLKNTNGNFCYYYEPYDQWYLNAKFTPNSGSCNAWIKASAGAVLPTGAQTWRCCTEADGWMGRTITAYLQAAK